MAIQISDEFREQFNRFLASGEFQSEADVLRAAFRALEMHEADLASIREGLSDIDAGRVHDFDEVNAAVRTKHEWARSE